MPYFPPASSGGTPGGSNTQVQYNNSAAFAGSANLVWDNTNQLLTVGTGFGKGPQAYWYNIFDKDSAPGTAAGSISGNSNGVSISTAGGYDLTLAPTTSRFIIFNQGAKVNHVLIDNAYSYQTPSTGFSITLSSSIWHTILDPAGTLATGTITMPASPTDGMLVDVRCSQVVTSLTISPNSGQSVKGAPTSFAVGGNFTAIYRAANTTWYF